MKLQDAVVRIRSKNAGPYWVTIDIFCGEPALLKQVAASFSAARIADLVHQPVNQIKRFEIESLSVLKVSYPRSIVQGDRYDRDMHGAQYAHLLGEAELTN